MITDDFRRYSTARKPSCGVGGTMDPLGQQVLGGGGLTALPHTTPALGLGASLVRPSRNARRATGRDVVVKQSCNTTRRLFVV